MGCAQSEIAPQNEAPKKGCTDVLWLIIYILFWILMVSIWFYSEYIALTTSTVMNSLHRYIFIILMNLLFFHNN